MLLADRLILPTMSEALLLDMDGVVIDSLGADVELVTRLLSQRGLLSGREVTRDLIREYFPYDIPEFWHRVLTALGMNVTSEEHQRLVETHQDLREKGPMAIIDGMREVLEAANHAGLPVALVSNNPRTQVERLISRLGLRDYFTAVVGNDGAGMRKKPAPDPYLEAAKQLSVDPSHCLAIEDSQLGAESAAAAGCFVVGVATGACTFAELSGSGHVGTAYTTFAPCVIHLGRDGVVAKSIVTPNEFVSHMLEHIAWRMGCSIDVMWTNDDWGRLGLEMGRAVEPFLADRSEVSVLGMIDDGSCELTLRCGGQRGVTLRASAQVDLDWFLALRCEQLSSGEPLVQLLEGIGYGCGIDLDVLVASVEDPHHSWEGIYRALGIGFEKLSKKISPAANDSDGVQRETHDTETSHLLVERGWQLLSRSATETHIVRETAESVVSVRAELTEPDLACRITVGDTVNVSGAADLLREFALGAGLNLSVDFSATRLSSSHVVMEDIGMTLGRALREVAVIRMSQLGIYGAGSNISDAASLPRQVVRVGVSMEGRKFWKYVPLDQTYEEFRRSFLVGHTLANGLYTEDLDDFIDGFAGGMQASVIVHVSGRPDPEVTWPQVFRGLGEAVGEMLSHNPYRVALIPGVKATLA